MNTALIPSATVELFTVDTNEGLIAEIDCAAAMLTVPITFVVSAVKVAFAATVPLTGSAVARI